MTTLRAYKFLVTPVLQVYDDDDRLVAEANTEQPDVVFGLDGLVRYAEGFEQAIARRQAEMNGSRQ